MVFSVIGGGIVGLLVARELSIAGYSVSVWEQRTLGSESSWAAGGILSPLHPWRYPDPVNYLVQASQRVYPALCAELLRATGIDPGWTLSGLLRLGDEEEASARAFAARFGAALLVGVPQEWSETARVRFTQPSLLMPEVAQVRSPRLLQALAADVRQRGVVIHEQAEVHGFQWAKDRLTALLVNGEEVATQGAIVTAGAWSGALLARYGLTIPVRPVKGQMIVLQAPVGLLKRMILQEGRYLVPRRDGAILVGSTIEEQGFDKTLTDEARAELRQFAVNVYPDLSECRVTHQWAGLRPFSPHGVPFIDEHPEMRGLYVNTGHFRNGIVLGPASAKLLVDRILERSPDIDPAPYGFQRAS